MPNFLHPDKENFSDDELFRRIIFVRKVSEILQGNARRWKIWKSLLRQPNPETVLWIMSYYMARRD
jgi:hypothetical protein